MGVVLYLLLLDVGLSSSLNYRSSSLKPLTSPKSGRLIRFTALLIQLINFLKRKALGFVDVLPDEGYREKAEGHPYEEDFATEAGVSWPRINHVGRDEAENKIPQPVACGCH